MLDLLFDEDGGSVFLRNVGGLYRTARLSNLEDLQEKARHQNPENRWPWNALFCFTIKEEEEEEEEEDEEEQEEEEEEEAFVCRWE
jgi:hypothetical protein